MKLAAIQPIAEALVRELAPACERIEIAGSIRRQVPQVSDVELVAIPRVTAAPTPPGEQEGLFGAPGEQRCALWQAIEDLGRERVVPARIQGDPEEEDPLWLRKRRPGESRYWRLWLPRKRVKVDLFLTAPMRWGATYTIRTGSADFSAALVQHAREIGCRFDEGLVFDANGLPVPTPEERAVFRAMGLAWIPPRRRVDRRSLVPSDGCPGFGERQGTCTGWPGTERSTIWCPDCEREYSETEPRLHRAERRLAGVPV